MPAVSGSYAEFSSTLHAVARPARIPLDGTIEISHRCPLSCQHCYNNLPMGDAGARKQELTTDEHRRILDEIAGAGCLWLLYTGGEIFARPDFLEIYRHAQSNGLLLTLFTNGTLLTPRIADTLAAHRPFSIEITLYGATRETYERLTRIPGSYDRCLRGIGLLLERGLPLKLKTVAVSVNRHEVWAMKQMAADLGVEFKFDAMMSPRIDCSQSPLAVRLRPEDVVAFDWDDPYRGNEWRRQLEYLQEHPLPASDEVYSCGGGLNSFAIDPYGKMSICTLSHVDAFDLRGGSFREGWEQFLGQVRRRKLTRLTKCVHCQLKAVCSMCPANGELENGDAESPVDFLCRIGHLRAAVFGMDVPEHGDCEYCAGGAGHSEIAVAAAALRSRTAATEPLAAGIHLPMLGGDAGCAACRA